MTTAEKVAAVVLLELQRHAPFLDDPTIIVRSLSVVVKLTPSGDPRAVIAQFETEQTYDPRDQRGLPGAPATVGGAPLRPPTMGRKG